MNIVITGATKGIGKAIAEKFAADGHHFIVCARNLSDLEKVKSDFISNFPQSSMDIYACDISKKEQLKNFIDFIHSKFSKVDVLVNNAGQFINAEILQEEDEVFENTMSTNVSAVYYLCKAIGKEMKKNSDGYIFNIGSIAGLEPFVNCGAYTVSKFALHGLTKVLREELKNFGVKVCLVIPGATYTSSWQGTDLPKDRFVNPKDVAELIYVSTKLSKGALAEELHIQPLLGKI